MAEASTKIRVCPRCQGTMLVLLDGEGIEREVNALALGSRVYEILTQNSLIGGIGERYIQRVEKPALEHKYVCRGVARPNPASGEALE